MNGFPWGFVSFMEGLAVVAEPATAREAQRQAMIQSKSGSSVCYAFQSMSSRTQFGNTLFLSGFGLGSTAENLNRLHFEKNAPSPAEYDEAWLQRLIMRHPSLLPLDQIESAFNTVVPICIELRTNSGFLDNLLVTPTGDLALVECKLWRNPQARREVIAQIIDYAKKISGWTYERLQNAIKAYKISQRPFA